MGRHTLTPFSLSVLSLSPFHLLVGWGEWTSGGAEVISGGFEAAIGASSTPSMANNSGASSGRGRNGNGNAWGASAEHKAEAKNVEDDIAAFYAAKDELLRNKPNR